MTSIAKLERDLATIKRAIQPNTDGSKELMQLLKDLEETQNQIHWKDQRSLVKETVQDMVAKGIL